MKSLVAYYSKTGNTAKVAGDIAKLLKADVEEIVDLKDRDGPFGFLISIFDSIFRRETVIKEAEKKVSKYNLVVVGTPTWEGTVTPAVRTYLDKNKGDFHNVAFFCTCGDRNVKGFHEMEILSKKPVSVLEIRSDKINEKSSLIKIKEFCTELLK